LNFQSCQNATVTDIRVLQNTTPPSPNTQLWVRDSKNFTLLNSVMAMPNKGGSYPGNQVIQFQESLTALLKNNICYAGIPNNMVWDNATLSGNYVFMGCDGVACSTALSGFGWAGCGTGYCYAGGGTTEADGSHHYFVTNNYFNM